MKIVIGYPPFDSPKGRAFLAQNRQFQWGTSPWTAYPVVPAYAATMLKEAGHDVYWLDGIWGMQTYAEWEKDLLETNPDVLMLETKTPVVKLHWKIINSIKYQISSIKVVLVGDHVTALPEESLENSLVDYILTGGDYDFLLFDLCNFLISSRRRRENFSGPDLFQESENPTREGGDEAVEHGAEGAQGGTKTSGVSPRFLSGKRISDTEASECLPPGIYYRDGNRIKNTGKFQLNHNLNSLPFIDRDLTNWQLYAYKNSNYARTPGTYTMFGRDCYWGRCTFCSWTTLFPGQNYRQMSVKRALDEVGHILDNYPVKEIMDDSGTFPVGDWLREFCQGMIERGYHKRVRISCNMRFNSGLTREDYQLMGKAGFRFLLYGLESVNQESLDRINKNLKVEQIEPVLRWAKEAGLNPHPTAMIGYPWETRADAQKTLDFARRMFKEGHADTLQATIITPYPGTPLFAEAKEKGWLKTLDWERYDMREPILKTEMSDEEIKGLVQGLYKSILTPQFIFRKLKEALTDWDMFRYYLRMTFKFFSKLTDFGKND